MHIITNLSIPSPFEGESSLTNERGPWKVYQGQNQRITVRRRSGGTSHVHLAEQDKSSGLTRDSISVSVRAQRRSFLFGRTLSCLLQVPPTLSPQSWWLGLHWGLARLIQPNKHWLAPGINALNDNDSVPHKCTDCNQRSTPVFFSEHVRPFISYGMFCCTASDGAQQR